MATPYLIVTITAPTGKKAKQIAQALVATRLAACVNIVPAVESIYRWKGKIERAKESLLIVKARRSDFRRLDAFVRKIHPYDVPEIIAIPLERGSRAYLAWLGAETKPS